MKNANRLLALALACLAVVTGVEHFRTSKAIAAAEAAAEAVAKQPHRLGAAVNPSVPPMLHASTHLSTGSDPISDATPSQDGLFSASDKNLYNQRFVDRLLSVSEWTEEFECTHTTTAISTATIFDCDRPWRAQFLGTNAAVTLGTTDANHPGTIDIYAGTAATGASGITRFTQAQATFMAPTTASAETVTVDVMFELQTLSDGTNTYAARLGLMNSVAALPPDGAFIEYSSASPDNGNFTCRTCNTSVCNNGTGGSTVAAVANTWYHGQIVDDGTTVSCSINGTNIGSTTSTLPAAAVNVSASIISSAGTATGRHLIFDAAGRQAIWSPKRAL